MSSWFDSVKSFSQNLVGPTVSANIVKAADTALTILTKPIQSVTGRFDKAYATTQKQGAVSLVAQGATNVVIATAPFSSAIRGAVVGTVSKLSPTTKILGTGAALVGIPYLAANPSKIPEFSGLPAAGADIPKNPSLDSGIDYVKTHPYLSAAALTAGLAALGFGAVTIASLLSNYANTKAVKENTQATINPIPTSSDNNDYKDQIKIIEANTKAQKEILQAQTEQQKELIALTNVPAVAAPSPVAPAGSSVVAKTTTKKKKKKAKKKTRRSKKKSIKRRKTK